MPFQQVFLKPNGLGCQRQGPAENLDESLKPSATGFRQSAEKGVHTAGIKLKALAENIRTQGPHAGAAGSATMSIASTMESSGDYLQRKSLKAMADDVANVIRKNPIAAMLVAFGLGSVLARATRKS